MLPDRVRSIAIVGGGPAGWLAAATLARLLKPDFCDIRLIDDPRRRPGPISESALPSFHRLNKLLGINEQDLMQRTSATFKLGTRFGDWGRSGAYFHTFGALGAKLDAVPFHHYWIRLNQSGFGGALQDYSTASVASNHARFARPADDRRSMLSRYSYGYHFHGLSLCAYLKSYAQAHGATCVEGKVVELQLRGEDGFIDALQLDDGSSVRADLYIDCRGPDAVALSQAFESPRVDWSHWLPCDRAIAVPCVHAAELAPYSQSVTRPSGWRWHTPLQQCSDIGYAYSSSFTSDAEAQSTHLSDLPGSALAEPRLIHLSPGRPARFWDKNWLTLASSTFEPLESTGLHLVQTGITRLVTLFPVRRFSPTDVEEYNRLTTMEHERVRDFLILHYKATTRADSALWEYCRHMEIPDTLRAKIELFQDSGRIAMLESEHFGEDSWLSVLIGQGIAPDDYDPLADVLGIDQVKSALTYMRSMICDQVNTLPTHAEFVSQNCPAFFVGML